MQNEAIEACRLYGKPTAKVGGGRILSVRRLGGKKTTGAENAVPVVFYVVEPSGIEPLASCVQGRRSPS